MCLMPLRPPFSHVPQKSQGLGSLLHQVTGPIGRLPDARGQDGQGHFEMGIGESLVKRCPGHRDLSGSKIRMGQAHQARVRPEPLGRRVRKDIRSGWTIAQK